MKNSIKKTICILCVFIICIVSYPKYAYADNNKFLSLNIAGYNDDGTESVKKNNVFYIKNNMLYAPIKLFEDYTLYDYDKDHQSFVRIGQNYNNASSKVVIDYENKKVNVFFSQYYKETYDIDLYSFADTYFFPLDKMAAYLKSSIVYKNSNSISIISSGISLCDALYDYSVYNSSLNYLKILDNLFVGDEKLYYAYTVAGFFSNTVFSCKISNLVAPWGKYENYCTILDNAVTNTDVYRSLENEDSILATLSGINSDLYNKIYKKAQKVYKLSSNSITTMFDEYKQINSFGDESPYDNFFPDEQLEIDKINEITDKVDVVNHFIETADYLNKFYSLNADNRDALKTIFETAKNDPAGLAIKETRSKYSDSIVESGFLQLTEQLSKKYLKEAAKAANKSIFTKFNKVKLATGIVSGVFKLAGFDLTDNSSYEVLLADELVTYITNHSEILEKSQIKTKDDSEKLRLTLIITMLVEIEGYKLGNKVAKRIDKNDSNHYKSILEELTNRVSLLYLAGESSDYDSTDGINNIIIQNKKQIDKIDLSKSIDEETAKSLIDNNSSKWRQAYIDFLKNYMNKVDEPSYCGFTLVYIDDDNIPELVIRDGIAHIAAASVYTFVNSKIVKLVGDLSGTYGIIGYVKRKGLVYSNVTYQGNSTTTIYSIDKGNCKKLISLFSNEAATPVGKVPKYRINDKAVSQKEYNSACDKYKDNNLSYSDDGDVVLTSDFVEYINNY